MRLFEKYAVAVGGGYNHRLDLSSGILIKDNHIKSAGSITRAVSKMKLYSTAFPIEIEVENSEEIEEALKAGVDGFLLDNMSVNKVSESVRQIRSARDGNSYFIEASGGINLNNLIEYIQTGVDAVSIGAITHSVKSAEIHLEIVK
jgi:nicotinate-nucleotide pyrophosphorylase (carboxylating)